MTSYDDLLRQISDLTGVARETELARLISIETDTETARRLTHSLRYTTQERVEVEFLADVEKTKKRRGRKSAFSPAEISAFKQEFFKN